MPDIEYVARRNGSFKGGAAKMNGVVTELVHIGYTSEFHCHFYSSITVFCDAVLNDVIELEIWRGGGVREF